MKIRKSEIMKGEEHIMGVNATKGSVNMKARVIIRQKGQVTLPKRLLDNLNLEEGDQLEIGLNESGEIVITPMIPIPRCQSWFWEEEWQKGEKEAEADIAANNMKTFDSLDDLFADLDSDD